MSKDILARYVHQYVPMVHAKLSDGREIIGIAPGTYEYARAEAATIAVLEIRREKNISGAPPGVLTVDFVAEVIHDSLAATLVEWQYNKPWCRNYTLQAPPPGWPGAAAERLAEIPYAEVPEGVRSGLLRAARLLLDVWIPLG